MCWAVCSTAGCFWTCQWQEWSCEHNPLFSTLRCWKQGQQMLGQVEKVVTKRDIPDFWSRCFHRTHLVRAQPERRALFPSICTPVCIWEWDENSVLLTRLLVNFLCQNPMKCDHLQQQSGHLRWGAGAAVVLPLSDSHEWIKVLQLHLEAWAGP